MESSDGMLEPLPLPWEPSPEAERSLPPGSSHRDDLSVKWLRERAKVEMQKQSFFLLQDYFNCFGLFFFLFLSFVFWFFLCSISICVKKRTRLLLGRLTSSRLLGSCKSFNPKLYTESLRTKTLAHGDVCEVFQSWPVLPHMWELDFVERGLKKSENQATNQRREQKNKVCQIKKQQREQNGRGNQVADRLARLLAVAENELKK